MQAPTDNIDPLRARIEAIDARLAELVAERCRVSEQVQRARLAAGGPRVVPSREAEIIRQWQERLGPPGGQIAQALLELARGACSLGG